MSAIREQFETWALSRFINSSTLDPLQRCATEPETYHYPVVETAWAAWQASRDFKEGVEISAEVKAMLERFEADEKAMLELAESFVRESGRASISALQRNFKIGYGSARRLMDRLVASAVVTSIDSEGRRSILPRAAQ